MINRKQRARITRAVNKLVKAAIENSWSGAKDPTFWEEYEQEHKEAKAKLKQVLDSLTVEE